MELIAKEIPIAASSQASFSTGSTRDLRAWTLTRPEAVCFGTARWVQRKVRRQVQRKDPQGCNAKFDVTGRFRGGPRFAEYRSHINGLFVEPVIARHFERIEG